MKMLFVGATGNIGRRVVPFLKPDFDLILAAKGGGEVCGLPVQDVDLTNWESTLDLVAQSGADVLVNCAIQNYQNPDGTDQDWRDADVMRSYHAGAIDVNIKGAFHLYEAAKSAKVKRVIYISSMTIVLADATGQLRDAIGAHPPEFPYDIYACAKHCGEEMARVYTLAKDVPLDVACLRLGQPYPTDTARKWAVDTPHKRGLALAHGDTAGAIAAAARASFQGFGVFQIVSNADENWVDLSVARALGYEPKFTFEADGLRAPDGTLEAYQ